MHLPIDRMRSPGTAKHTSIQSHPCNNPLLLFTIDNAHRMYVARARPTRLPRVYSVKVNSQHALAIQSFFALRGHQKKERLHPPITACPEGREKNDGAKKKPTRKKKETGQLAMNNGREARPISFFPPIHVHVAPGMTWYWYTLYTRSSSGGEQTPPSARLNPVRYIVRDCQESLPCSFPQVGSSRRVERAS